MARRRSRKANTLLDIFEAVTELGLKLGGLVFVLVLGYIIYGFVTKDGFGQIGSLPKADRLRLIGVVTMAGKLLWISGSVAVFCVVARYYVEETLGYIISCVGVVLYLGTPFLFAMRFSGDELAHNQAIAILVGNVRTLGMTVFLPGVAMIVRDIILRIVMAISRLKQKKGNDKVGSFLVGAQIDAEPEPYRPRAYSMCWQMPYCRDFIRRSCPVFDTKKPCWRIKKGCMCDGDIILNALKAQGGEGRSFQRELMFRGADVGTAKTTLTGGQKRMRCRRCVIYEFHQAQKYKLLSPMVFPLVVGTIWIMYPQIEQLTRTTIGYTDRFMKTVSFLPTTNGGTLAVDKTPEVVFAMFIVWLGIMAVSYALRLVEFCVFKLQI
jgi:hypothetical protein